MSDWSNQSTLSAFAPVDIAQTDVERRLAFFYELPLEFGKENRLDALLQVIVERVTEVITDARRGAVLIKDPKTGRLGLLAHVPAGAPAMSQTLAQRAMDEASAFIFHRPPEARLDVDPGRLDSVTSLGIQSAMFAPLMWKDQALGAICVDSRETASAFTQDDLRLLQAVAHHAALAIANLQLQAEWKQQAEVQSNILKLISPQIADRLMRQRGRLRLGGDFCNATMLFADLRGFTNLSATMSLDEVTEMLEDYFEELVPRIYEQEGTIFKFIGDEIFAVFGSPNHDEQQHRHAVQSAFAMQEAMKVVNAKRERRRQRTAQLGIGIHCGEVVSGLIGAAERMEYTVIGDAVNRASRYCDGAGGGEILISTDLHQWVWNLVEATRTSIETKHEGDFAAYRITPKQAYGHVRS